jgi:hypothetical protein
MSYVAFIHRFSKSPFTWGMSVTFTKQRNYRLHQIWTIDSKRVAALTWSIK